MFSEGMKFSWVAAWLGLFMGTVSAQEQWVYFGTYTGGGSEGIYVARFDPATGQLTPPKLAAKIKNPSYLAVHPSEKFIYAVSEVGDAQGQAAGALAAYALNRKTGALTLLNEQLSGGTYPCHISVAAQGRCALVANYGSGSFAAFPIQPDGSLAAAGTTIQHHGASVNPHRQAGPHAHFITADPGNRFVLACDLGLDQIAVYRLEAERAQLTANTPAGVFVAPGAGVRHLVCHPNGRWVYAINEMGLTVTMLDYDATAGTLTVRQTLSTVAADYPKSEKDSGAGIALHPNGKFLYVSNRGPNDIAGFAIQPTTGALTPRQRVSTQGKTPRHFAIDPTGQWLLAENQDSATVIVFALDAPSGEIKSSVQTVRITAPICAVFVAAEN